MERALLARQREMDALVSATPGTIYRCQLDRTMSFLSDGVTELLGHPPSDFINNAARTFASVIWPEDVGPAARAIAAAVHAREPWELTYRVWHADGRMRWACERGQACVGGNGEQVLVGFIVDVTAQREAEYRLGIALRAANLGLWDWHIPSGRVHLHETAHAMMGYKCGDWPAMIETLHALHHLEDLPFALADLDRHLRGELPTYRNEHRLKRADGSWQWILSVGEVVERAEDGTPTRLIGFNLDVHSLRVAREEAEAANRAKSAFLANISHEIRTPMTAILGFADLLLDPSIDAEQSREHIAAIRRNGEHLIGLMNDILDLSKIEAGQMAVERNATRVDQVVNDVLSLMRVRAHARQLELDAVCETAVPRSISSDALRLKQILVNLVGNAIKFTEAGAVRIRLRHDRAAGQLSITVADTGIGIEPEAIARLFAPFAQADASTTRRFGGTGLGLHLSQRIAAMLDGRISVASKPGRGSTFTLTLAAPEIDADDMLMAGPLVAVAPGPGRDASRFATATPDPRALADIRIFLAEDGPDNQRLIAHHLRKAGATVSVFDNGRLALEALTVDGAVDSALNPSPPCDMVLTDMQMPEMDGYTLASTLRTKGWTGPIVALTAHAMEGDADKCLNAGCDGYATKPIERKELIALCEAHCRKTMLARANQNRGPDVTLALDQRPAASAVAPPPGDIAPAFTAGAAQSNDSTDRIA